MEADWDSSEAMAARNKLRMHPTVQKAIHEAWTAVRECAGGSSFDRATFFEMYRKLYLHQAVVMGEPNVEPIDCVVIAHEDWERDAGADGETR